MPEAEWAKMIVGYQDYYDMNDDEKSRAFWMKMSTELGKWGTKILPSLNEGLGIDNYMMQEFGLYPRAWTREMRENIRTRTGDVAERVSEAIVDPLAQLASDIGRMRK